MRPRLANSTSCPAAIAASAMCRPANFVPPRKSMRIHHRSRSRPREHRNAVQKRPPSRIASEVLGLNELTGAQRERILGFLRDGMSLRSIERLTGHRRETISRYARREGLELRQRRSCARSHSAAASTRAKTTFAIAPRGFGSGTRPSRMRSGRARSSTSESVAVNGLRKRYGMKPNGARHASIG